MNITILLGVTPLSLVDIAEEHAASTYTVDVHPEHVGKMFFETVCKYISRYMPCSYYVFIFTFVGCILLR
jgi:hypothetical protein